MARQVGMTAAVTLVGVGLLVNAAARFVPSDGMAHAAPVAAMTAGPNPPTIVWYGTGPALPFTSSGLPYATLLWRAWSDGTVELKRVNAADQFGGICDPDHLSPYCQSGWIVVSSPNDGLNAAADVNHDEQVNGADLAMLLGAWGPAPRDPTPPSDCPLELILP